MFLVFGQEFFEANNPLVAVSESNDEAIEIMWTLDFTEGGPRRNGKCQTINVWGEPIPRLYNTGEFGSFNTVVYCIGGLLQSVSTGQIAGAHAASLEAWD